MEFSDWLLFLHVLSAFVLVGALTVLWALVVGTRPAAPVFGPDEAARIGAVFGPAAGAGTVGTIVFGIWLALDRDDYEIWDGWIIAALVLWLVGSWAGDAAGRAFGRDPVGGRAAAIRLHAISTLAVLIILVLMIWKPGA